VDVGLLEEPSSDRLAGAPFEEHVVGDDDGAAAANVEQGEDVLDEVELLVLGGGPEVLAGVGYVFFLQGAFLGDEGDAALLAEGRICEDQAEALAGIGGEGVYAARDGRGIGVHAVQVEVHGAQPASFGNQLEAAGEAAFQVPVLVGVFHGSCRGDRHRQAAPEGV
jgi:hypothetical protein